MSQGCGIIDCMDTDPADHRAEDPGAATPQPSPTGPRARLLAALAVRDRAMLTAALALAEADRDRSGVPADVLLAVDGSLGRRARGALRTVARYAAHLPATIAHCRNGTVGFDVVTRICRAAATNRLTVAHCRLLDEAVAELLADGHGRWDADDLVEQVRDRATALRPDTRERVEALAVAEEAVWVHPDLFGGGRIEIAAGAEHFATAVAAIDATVAQHGLLDRTALRPAAAACPEEAADVAAANWTTVAAARAAGFFRLCRDRLAGRHAPDAAHDGRASRGDGPPIPSIRLAVTLDSLLAATDQPARVLMTLAGGRLRTTAATARRLAERDGATLETVVVDDGGTVLGVGRRTRVAPGWLSRLARDLHPRCVVPGCATTVTDLDHATRWVDGGTTDLDNLAPLCRAHHVAKDRDRTWLLAPDTTGTGTVTVTHAPTGWAATTRPTTAGPPAVPRRDAIAARRSPQPTRPRTRSRDPDPPSRDHERPPPTPGSLPF